MPLINAPAPVVLPIPVVLVDRDSRQFASAALVATDNVEVGLQAARALAGRIPPGSRLALFRLDANVPTTRQRETGFAEEAQRLGFVISIDRYLGADVRRARQIIYDSLLRQPVKAIFTPNELTTQAAYLALPTLPAIQRPRLVGVDYRPEFQQALENGQIDALVVQDAYQMGYLATHLLLDRLAGKTIPKRVTVPARVLTTSTLHQTEVLRFLQQYQPDNSNASGAKSQ
ncbi:substrate-binding domain-containing protein [Paludibacterium denitrificans]|nr:substrate-binding domain-containing protein [Paludibacterium denitrificans]